MVRYEASHPTISVRVCRDLYDQLQLKELRDTTGLGMADILKVGMEKVQAAAGDTHDLGFEDGYAFLAC
jgi:hypothetical protein